MSGADKAAAIREKAERLAGRSLGENGDALTEMAMERACRTAGLPGRLIPVPREITAGCGLAWKAAAEQEEAVTAALEEAGIKYSGVYRIEI